jgi:hypothetical protein
MASLGRRVAFEFIDAAFLAAAVVGSGIMIETLSVDQGLHLPRMRGRACRPRWMGLSTLAGCGMRAYTRFA